jgi:hypothetical protein
MTHDSDTIQDEKFSSPFVTVVWDTARPVKAVRNAREADHHAARRRQGH